MMWRRWILAAGLALLAGCATRTPAPAFWQLEAETAMPAQWSAQAPALFISATELPRYLDRPEVIERVAPGQLAPAEYHRWAEPLEDGLVRVLAEELARRLSSAEVAAYPARPRFPVDFQVVVDVERFDGRIGGRVTLVARWTLLEGMGGPTVASAREDIEVPAGNDMAAFVAAHSRALSEFAGHIATAAGRHGGIDGRE